MSRFIEGQDRSQSVLFPEQLEDWITEDNPVRAVDAFVEALDLAALEFDRARAADTGRPAYHPATLLKIYIYGYLNRIQSSRKRGASPVPQHRGRRDGGRGSGRSPCLKACASRGAQAERDASWPSNADPEGPWFR